MIKEYFLGLAILLRAGEEATKDEMVGRHHQLNGYEFGQTPGDHEGQPRMLQSMRLQS